MSLIQSIADGLHVTYYEAASILIGSVVVLLCIIYQCCIRPVIDCFKCLKFIVCCIPNMCSKCLLNPCWDCCFSRKKAINEWEEVPLYGSP